MPLRILARLQSCAALLLAAGAWAQDNPYTYVRMSLFVPWMLYFVFLAAVLIPFVVLMVLAWRKPRGARDIHDGADSGPA